MDAETQNRTVDTAIFSRVLYQLSYLGLRTIFYMDMARVSSKMNELAGIGIKKQPDGFEDCCPLLFDILTMQD